MSNVISLKIIDSTLCLVRGSSTSKYGYLFANKLSKLGVSIWCRKVTVSKIKKVSNESNV